MVIRGLKMKEYVFLAKERIENLYHSICADDSQRTTVEGKISTGFISGSVTRETTGRESTQSKLDAILKHIKPSTILSVDGRFIKSRLPMSWNSQNKIDRELSATFWIGSIEDDEDSPFRETRLLLIGSDHNIVGNDRKAGFYYSTSYIDAFFRAFEDDLNLHTFGINNSYTFRSADHDLSLFESIKRNERLSLADKQQIITHKFSSEWSICRYIEELRNTYMGNYCEYEFVAQVLFSRIFLDGDDNLRRYIIAAPLYVQRTKVFGQRTVYTASGQKYYLTSTEFGEHKKDGFKKLAYLLLSEGLVDEEKEFTQRMKDLYNDVNAITALNKKAKESLFVENATPIIKDYFYFVE